MFWKLSLWGFKSPAVSQVQPKLLPIRTMADNAFEWARQRGLVTKSEVHGAETADIPLDMSWSKSNESGSKIGFQSGFSMDVPVLHLGNLTTMSCSAIVSTRPLPPALHFTRIPTVLCWMCRMLTSGCHQVDRVHRRMMPRLQLRRELRLRNWIASPFLKLQQ